MCPMMSPAYARGRYVAINHMGSDACTAQCYHPHNDVLFMGYRNIMLLKCHYINNLETSQAVNCNDA